MLVLGSEIGALSGAGHLANFAGWIDARHPRYSPQLLPSAVAGGGDAAAAAAVAATGGGGGAAWLATARVQALASGAAFATAGLLASGLALDRSPFEVRDAARHSWLVISCTSLIVGDIRAPSLASGLVLQALRVKEAAPIKGVRVLEKDPKDGVRMRNKGLRMAKTTSPECHLFLWLKKECGSFGCVRSARRSRPPRPETGCWHHPLVVGH